MADNWVSPTSHNDLDAWTNEANAYDGNTGTYAYTLTSGGELELTIAAIRCDKIRLYATDFEVVAGFNDPTVTISVYYESAYHQIFSGSITKQTWVEKAIGSTEIVTKAKISGTLASEHGLYLYEFEFNSLVPTVETDACSDVKSTSFDANGDLKTSATTRGFHYSEFFDGFEWGVDTDPLDDSGGAITWTISVAGTSKAEIDDAQHYSGTRSARLLRDGTNNAIVLFTQSPVTATQVISSHIRKDAAAQIYHFHGNGTYRITVRIDATGDINYYDTSSHEIGSISIGTWFRLDIQNVNWATQTYDIYLDGILIKSGTGMQTVGTYSGQVAWANTAGTNSEVWLDEVAVWDVEDEDGTFGAGEYSLKVSGLDHSTTYYVQAFAENAAGFGYGAVVSQATTRIRSTFFKMF